MKFWAAAVSVLHPTPHQLHGAEFYLGGAGCEDGQAELKQITEKHIPSGIDENNNDLWQICREANIAVSLRLH